MLTQNEITALNLSPTKKDFVQIWNELLEVAGKLSERWDPTSTNESDPGIVILKALTGIADKLNYNIDKNILEAFMPTAAQEESMRKLCDMMGYNMKYYRSAVTEDVTIKYYNPDPSDVEAEAMSGNGQYIPKFTVITNNDKDVSYFTTNQKELYISKETPSITVPCMEGQVVKCESNNSNGIITANQITENNRFYLPETTIAENGIFIYNVVVNSNSGELTDGERWEKVDNLNVQERESKVFKFGYDSYESRPYVEFPGDFSKLFNEGIFLYYTRTSGINGNVSAGTLTRIELPSSGSWKNVSAESLSVENPFAITSGENPETIKQAYNNFKKTVGTFETLVTCRDYMNKIYSFVAPNGKPVVSNVLVTDIRNDLNRAATICSCDGAGIFFKDVPLSSNTPISEDTKPVYINGNWYLGSAGGAEICNPVANTDFDIDEKYSTIVKEGYWALKQNNTVYMTKLPVGKTDQAISNFDIVLYPFKSYNQIKSSIKDIRTVYDNSFKYSEDYLSTIKQMLGAEETETISYNIKTPDIGDILSINNYLRLSATIATNAKVTTDESEIIIKNIKKALANAFNMRELDFGDEIPFDSIIEVIESADTRIKVASLNDPALYTTYSVLESRENKTPVIVEYAVASDCLDTETAEKIGKFTKNITVIEETSGGKLESKIKTVSTFDTPEARKIYNKLAVRNVLAGRVPLFNYNTDFTTSFYESAYQTTSVLPAGSPKPASSLADPSPEDPFTMWSEGDITYTGQYNEKDPNNPTYTKTVAKYPDGVITEDKESDKANNYITDIKAKCKVKADDKGKITDAKLAAGEFIKFRAPNFTTIKTYPAYVNYHLVLTEDTRTEAKAAEAESLFNILDSDRGDWTTENQKVGWQKVLDYFTEYDSSNKTQYVKTFTISQTVSTSSNAESGDTTINIGEQTTTIGVGLNNTQTDTAEYTVESLMALSGCVKLTNENFKAHIEWVPEGGTSSASSLELVLEDFTNPFITNANVLADLKAALDNALTTYRESLPNGSFTVSFSFMCVPFEAKSLAAWESFILECSKKDQDYAYQVLDFVPVYENNKTLFWRLFGDGYDIGKYVTTRTEKLLEFNSNYFGLLPNTYLKGIYLAKSLGDNTVPIIIKNNEEYKLRDEERLYIEYTPSSTTGDTTKDAEPIKEVYEAGTIIRPSGFEGGLTSSSAKTTGGSHKDVSFEATGDLKIPMFSLGANEQIEIRDFAQVVLSKDTIQDLYVYKNFNGVLETAGSTYTLKDGEAIFYTDKNKTDYAYFTTGTEVVLEGDAKLPEFETAELATILDSGIQEIPWRRLVLMNDTDKIIFKEYQYITLGAEDTLNSLSIVNSVDNQLDETWRDCADVEYVLAGDPDTKITLPSINLQNSDSNGWKACSILELNVAQNVAQSLRKTDKVETSLELSRTSTTGGSVTSPDDSILPQADTSLSFKTNLACQACGNVINIDDVWSNPDNIKGFQLKVFSADEPMLVTTKTGSVSPYNYSGDILAWTGAPLEERAYLETWNHVDLEKIRQSTNFDNALRLPINILPNTYGVFCIYVDYSSTAIANNAKTWIEVVPGTKINDVALLNENNALIEHRSSDQYLNKIYLNKGINCVRVNTAGKIFIKASSNAEGNLYFDDLRLVNSQLLKYIDSDNKHIALKTQGLNLVQLGYLDASENASDKLDTVAKEKLQKAYVDELMTSIRELVNDSETTFAEDHAKLVELLPRVKALVETEKIIQTELNSIKVIGDSRFKMLAEKYKEVKNTLDREKALQAALDNNKTAEELEQILSALLSSFNVLDDAQQQTLQELSDILASAETYFENISNKDIVKDFNASSAVEQSKALTKIKAIVLGKIEDYYQEQLATIADSLDNSVNSASKNTILGILDTLKAKATASTRAVLQTKVNELSNLVENSVDSLLEELVRAAYSGDDGQTPDYQQVLAILTQLRGVIDSTDIKVLISEIAQAVSTSDDDQLKTLLSPLFKGGEFNTAGLNASVNSTILTKIDEAYESAAKKASDTKSKIETLKSTITSEYTTGLQTIFKGLKTALDSITNATSGIDELLNILTELEYKESEDDSQVKRAVEQLKEIIEERSDLIGALDILNLRNWRDNLCKAFIQEAIIAVWPEFINTRLSTILERINTTFSEAFEKTSNTILESDLANIYASETSIMKQALKVEDLKILFTKTKSIRLTDEQRKSDAELIAELSGLVQDTVELYTSSGALDTNDNLVILNLIEAWRTADVNKDIKLKQKLQSSLKEELQKAISTREQLFSVIASLLCPNIAKYIKELDEEDDFNKKLLAKLLDLEKSIMNCARDLTIEDDLRYKQLLERQTDDFKVALPMFKISDTTLLPDSINSALTGLAEQLELINNQISDTRALENLHLERPTSEWLGKVSITDSDIKNYFGSFHAKISELESKGLIDIGYEDAFRTIMLEEQLLDDIRAIDINREFYYNAPVVSSFALDLNASTNALNTLMNPQVNYDVNNINNSFVISKLDIDFLDNGIQIARSSRLN